MARLRGSNNSDVIDGTSSGDIIDGRNGDDVLRGLGGADYIHAGRGDDDVDGGEGNDVLIGHLGKDTLLGGDGNDLVFGDLGALGLGFLFWWHPWQGFASGDADFVDGGAGSDFVFAGAGDDEARYGVSENLGATDRYAGGRGIDTLTLDMTKADWFRLDVQADIQDYLTFLAINTDPVSGEANGQGFTFGAFDLTARQFEALRVLVDGVELTPEDDPVTANDDDAGSVGEDDGDTALGNVLDNDDVPDLTYEVALVSGVSKGLLTFNAGSPGAPDGSFSFDPNGEFEHLAVGETEDVTFTYEATDADRDTDQATVTITVTGANDAPVGVDDSASTDEDTVVSVDVLANDTDVDLSDTHTVDAISILDGGSGAGGAVSIVGNQIHWDPDGDYEHLAVGASTQVVIAYDLSDNNGGTSSAELTLTVNGANDAPVANDDGPVSVDEDSFIDINVLANDTDVDVGDTLTPTTFSALHGSVVLNNDHSLRYTPNPDYNGPDTLTYTISDGNGGTDTATVDITVDPVNDAPTTTPGTVAVQEDDNGGIITIDLSAYASDIDVGDTLSFSNILIARDATAIAFSDLGGGIIQIDTAAMGVTLDDGDVLTTQFTYTVMDDSGAPNNSATGTVDLTITGVDDVIVPPPANTAPVANALTVSATEDDPNLTIALSDLATDPGDTLTVTALTADRFDGILTNQAVPFTLVINDGVPELVFDDLSWFFIQEATAVDPAVPGDAILSDGELASVAVSFTVTDSIGQSASNVITLNLTGVAPEATGNLAPTADDVITPPGATPQFDPFSNEVVPTDITVGETGAAPITIDLDDITSDPDGDDSLLTFTLGALVIGTDEATGTPITAPYSFDPVTNIVSITVDETFPLADGESAVGTLEYTVSDGIDSTSAQITFNYVNPAPPPSATRTLDFEPFDNPDGASIVLDTLNPSASDTFGESYEGFLFQGTAAVIETDELGGGGRGGGGGTPGIASGQTTSSGSNVLVGSASETEVPAVDESGAPIMVQDTDERGNLLFDEGGAPIMVQDTMIAQDLFALVGPGNSGVPSEASISTSSFAPPGLTAAVFGTPFGFDSTFDLDGLSLNVTGTDDVIVTMTTYSYTLVETPINASFSSYEWVLETDTFEFAADALSPAEVLDFNDVAFADDAAVPNTDSTGFDDILAVSFEASDGSTIVLDDIFVTL